MRKRFLGRRSFTWIGVLALLAVLGYLGADMVYRKMNERIYQPRLAWAEALMEREKEWILANQGEDGEIYMNGEEAGNVNPYFSCQAALGLLQGTKERPAAERELSAAGRYLNWHTKVLLDSDGAVGIYEKKGDSFVRTDKGDSVDAYLGTYLELLGKYLLTAGSVEGLDSWEEGILAAVGALESLLEDGLTRVSAENDTKYLMDNLEVWRGLAALEEGLDAISTTSGEALAVCGRIEKLRGILEERITEVFWVESVGRWRVMEGDERFSEGSFYLDEFYPDGVAQIYPLIYGFPVEDWKAQKELYRDFTEAFRWEVIEENTSEFVWTMVGMGAAKAGDVERLEDFLKNYEKAFASKRDYPLYTGEAGWVCRECEWYCRYCLEKIEGHLLF